jgi:hypothetical protein
MAKKKYSKREFLKEGGRVAGQGALYGTVGGVLGKAYRTGRDYISDILNKISELENKLGRRDHAIEESDNPVTKYVAKPAKDLEDARATLWKKIFGISEKDKEDTRKKLNLKYDDKKLTKNKLNNTSGHGEIYVFGDTVRPAFEFTQEKTSVNELENYLEISSRSP